MPEIFAGSSISLTVLGLVTINDYLAAISMLVAIAAGLVSIVMNVRKNSSERK